MTDEVAADLIEQIRDAIDARSGNRKRFLDAWREETGWTGSYAQATRRLAQWLSEDDRHRFPVEALPVLIRVTGSASFLDPLLALEAKEQRRARVQRVERRRERFRLGNTLE